MKIGEKSKDGGLFAGIIVYPFGERCELYVSEEETELKYSEDLVDHGTSDEWDGAENTEKLLGKSPAADWCRSFGPEWYLPAKNELASLLPYGLLKGWYWSSTQYAVYTNDAWCQYFTNGCQDGTSKHNNYYRDQQGLLSISILFVRAVRRVKL